MTLDSVRATVLVENSTDRPDLKPEHGFALWIEAGEGRVLFDTGASGVVCENADALGVDLSRADAIVLSHGHDDHAGGLPAVARRAVNATVCAHPAARIDVGPLPVLLSRAPEVVVPGVHTTGEIERVTDFETAPGRPVSFPDDQAVYFETADGIIVVVGCAHAGLVNTLRHVARTARADRIDTVVDGVHLAAASDERLAKTADALAELGVRRLVLGHCTGDRALAFFGERFPGRVRRCRTGTALWFGRADA